MPWINDVSAIVFAGLPGTLYAFIFFIRKSLQIITIAGQESGNSLVDILFGIINPSAKLPYTIAKQQSDYPAQISFNLQVNNNNYVALYYCF